MKLCEIQKEIETTYQIDCPFLVDEFLLDEQHRKSFLSRAPWLAHSQEALLVEQEDKNLHVGLLFDSDLLEWSRNQAFKNLSPAHFSQAGPLIEGVSHFVYLLWRAEQERPVTQLELELQAEVDKFILLSREGSPENSEKILEGLFSDVAWLDTLCPEERQRYELSLKMATKYCRFLKTRFLTPHPQEGFLPEIRSFYRMSQAEKIRHIQA
jgi:hypothetical protein